MYVVIKCVNRKITAIGVTNAINEALRIMKEDYEKELRKIKENLNAEEKHAFNPFDCAGVTATSIDLIQKSAYIDRISEKCEFCHYDWRILDFNIQKDGKSVNVMGSLN